MPYEREDAPVCPPSPLKLVLCLLAVPTSTRLTWATVRGAMSASKRVSMWALRQLDETCRSWWAPSHNVLLLALPSLELTAHGLHWLRDPARDSSLELDRMEGSRRALVVTSTAESVHAWSSFN